MRHAWDPATQWWREQDDGFWRARAERDCPLPPAFVALRGRLLDLGCGDGRLARAYASQGHQVVGVDVSWAGLRRAALGTTPARYVQADAAQLPFRAGVFDGVALYGVLEHLRRPRVALAEVARVLRSGGRVAVYEANQDRSWLLQCLRPGLENLEGFRVAPGARLPDGVQGVLARSFGQTKARWVTARWARGLLRRQFRRVRGRTYWCYSGWGRVDYLTPAGRIVSRPVRWRTWLLGLGYHLLNWVPGLGHRGEGVYLRGETR